MEGAGAAATVQGAARRALCCTPRRNGWASGRTGGSAGADITRSCLGLGRAPTHPRRLKATQSPSRQLPSERAGAPHGACQPGEGRRIIRDSTQAWAGAEWLDTCHSWAGSRAGSKEGRRPGRQAAIGGWSMHPAPIHTMGPGYNVPGARGAEASVQGLVCILCMAIRVCQCEQGGVRASRDMVEY